MTNGLTHLYYGDGKGKTSAAIGLALRAAGHHKKVVFLQFLKGSPSGEILSLKEIPFITVLRNEKDLGFISRIKPDQHTLSQQTSQLLQIQQFQQMHNTNLHHALTLVENSECDLLILDEVCVAYRLNVLDQSLIENLVVNKPAFLELVLTGREPARLFFDHADYVTRMEKVKHPYDQGIRAREGIEF